MKKLLFGAFVCGLAISPAFAQDVHFTQYFISPLTLNPAHTGLIESDYRISGNIRQQWYSVSSYPYFSGTIAADIPTLRGKLPEGDALGVGVLALYDKAGTGALTNTTVGLSLAYHKSFGAEKQHTLSLGLQAYYTMKSIDFSKLVFGDQFNPDAPGFTNPSTSEQLGNADMNYPDFNVGLLYTGRVSSKATVYAGASYYHLTQPEEKFLAGGNSDFKLNSRLSISAGGSFEMNQNTVGYISALYQTQGPASELVVGGAVGFVLNPGHDEYTKNTIFYLGAFYRVGDAIAPYIGFEWKKMKIGMSYDATVSTASNMTGGQGAWEFSAIFLGFIDKNPVRKYNFACPKF